MDDAQNQPRGDLELTRIQLTGGKKFSRDVQPTDKDGNPVGLWRVRWHHLAQFQCSSPNTAKLTCDACIHIGPRR